jgi:hypothetical protein
MTTRPLATVVWACAAWAALARPAPAAAPNPAIHPAVARIMAVERNGASLGSGTLVAVGDTYGLVVTNWHVVRDAAGMIVVSFPDGFRSPATVLRTDRDWDLAALAIWRPNAQPVPLAVEPPRPGEPLTIAGYGKGPYRSVSGRCTQYVSPGGNLPFEMVELAAPAREGDSGGPILNQRGELAGVLFGTGWGKTTGSYCGRVRWFLSPVVEQFNRLPPDTMLAQRPAGPKAPPVSIGSALGGAAEAGLMPPPRSDIAALPDPVAANGGGPAPLYDGDDFGRRRAAEAAGASPTGVAAIGDNALTPPLGWGFDALKTLLAVVGVALLAINGLRLLGRAVG